VDGTELLTLVSGADGRATVSYVAPEGGHVMRVVFVGDDTHKRARRSQGFSVVAGATAVPAAPVLTATPGSAVVNLSWTVPLDDGSAITGYSIYRGTTSGGETLLTTVAPGTTYADLAVIVGTTYYYRVLATNADGDGALSNEVSAAPL
jgi:hypothetical protein